jgi:16S rRNA G966 N2-methylase RsmD
MATDYALMMHNLMSFYDFKDKAVVSIGAGGGQAVTYSHPARRIVAIDQDATALDQLRGAVAKSNMGDKFEFVHGDFLTMNLPARGDVVIFDFCLHEMADVTLALGRAAKLAPDVVVFDHGRASEWAYYVVEEAKVGLSWKSLERFKVVQHQEFATEQKFRDHAELLAKVKPQGEIAIQRIGKFRGRTDITIPMTYELALVQFTRALSHGNGMDQDAAERTNGQIPAA